jgi:hypothetical protein
MPPQGGTHSTRREIKMNHFSVYHYDCICWDGKSSNKKTALKKVIASNEALNNEGASLDQFRFQNEFRRVRDAHSVRLEYKVIEHRAAK